MILITLLTLFCVFLSNYNPSVFFSLKKVKSTNMSKRILFIQILYSKHISKNILSLLFSVFKKANKNNLSNNQHYYDECYFFEDLKFYKTQICEKFYS